MKNLWGGDRRRRGSKLDKVLTCLSSSETIWHALIILSVKKNQSIVVSLLYGHFVMPHIVSLPVGYIGILEKNRSDIPPCVVKKKMITFPAEEGNYTGYKDDDTGDDDDSALMAS